MPPWANTGRAECQPLHHIDPVLEESPSKILRHDGAFPIICSFYGRIILLGHVSLAALHHSLKCRFKVQSCVLNDVDDGRNDET